MTGRLFIQLIAFYKTFISPVLPPSCRFYPSCSDYARGSIEAHGAGRGAYLALRRILRCHPYNRADGFDPVPDRFHWRTGRAKIMSDKEQHG